MHVVKSNYFYIGLFFVMTPILSTGCSAYKNHDTAPKTIKSDITDGRKIIGEMLFKNNVKSDESVDIIKNNKSKKKTSKPKHDINTPYFKVSKGDSIAFILKRLSRLNDNIYINTNQVKFTALSPSSRIYEEKDLTEFFLATSNKVAEFKATGNYVKFNLTESVGKAQIQAAKCSASLSGSTSLLPIMTSLCSAASVPCDIAPDAKIMLSKENTVSFKGNCANAIEKVAQASGSYTTWKDNYVIIADMTTVYLDLAIPSMTKRQLDAIINDSTPQGSSNNSSNNGSSASGIPSPTTSASSSSTGDLGGLKSELSQDLEVTILDLLKEIKSTDGKIVFMKETGQIMAYDHHRNIQQIQEVITRFNDTILTGVNVEVTFYKMTYNSQEQIGIDLNAALATASKSFSLGIAGASQVVNPFLSGSISQTRASGLTRGAVLNILGKYGKAEVVQKIDVHTQSTIPVSMNISSLRGYLSSFTNTAVANVGTTTTPVTRDAPDGIFLSVTPKVINDGLNISLETYLNKDEFIRFNSQSAGSNTIQTVDRSKQSSSGMNVLEQGVPMIIGRQTLKGETQADLGVPNVKELPLIGAMLDAITSSKDRIINSSEIIIVIKATSSK